MSELAKIESFRKQLAISETIEEIKLISNATEAYQQLMVKQKVAKKSIDEIGEFDIEVKEKLADWLNQFYPTGVRSDNRNFTGTNLVPVEMPVTRKESAMVRSLKRAKIAEPERIQEITERIKQSDKPLNAKTLGNELKKVEKQEIIKRKEIEYKNIVKQTSDFNIDIFNTDKKFNIIYADPAWRYWDGGEKNQSLHYSTMTIKEICDLPVKNIADENCILFIWVTYPILNEVFNVIESWGFKYSTCGFVWVKRNKNIDTPFFGNGSWTRANSELCLIATKGHPTRIDASISQVLEDKIMEHSKKPERVRALITQLVGDLPRIELFNRKQNDESGWFNWGNE